MERNILVDKLKGYACFLVLFGHVIMGIRLAGVSVPFFFEGMEKFIWSFHVALFMFLSGVVYKETGEWKGKKTKSNFILHKLLNLGVPYIAFSALYILINSFVAQANSKASLTDILFIWKTPIAQYWFLYALFFLFLIWTLCSGVLKNWQTTLIVFAVACLATIFNIPLGSFSIVIYSGLAFGLGTVLDFKSLTKPARWVKIFIIVSHIVTGIVTVAFDLIELPFVEDIMLLFGIYSSIMLISLLQNIKPVHRFLLFTNKYSLQIYLLHTIFTAGIRIVLVNLGVFQWWIHVVLGTTCGIVFSVLAAVIAKKTKVLDFFFFPVKTYNYLKSAKEKA